MGVDGLVTRPVLAGGRVVVRTGTSMRDRLGRGRARLGVAWQRLSNRARARRERRRGETSETPSRSGPDAF